MIFGSSSIKSQLKNISPSKISVAYIGNSWADIIDVKSLEIIIVSPSLGSNPEAIVDVAEQIGWDNVWLLEKLHSKIYIGDNAIMIGSANLSNNAFGDIAQEEACVVLNSHEDTKEANDLFNSYLHKAKAQFPNKEKKVKRIEKLRIDHRKAITQKLLPEESKEIRKFSDFNVDSHGMVYFTWHFNEDTDYTDNVPIGVQSDIANELHLSRRDKKPINQWVLTWLASSRGTVDDRSKPSLIYIHEIYENGSSDEGYERLCVERTTLKTPNKPFDENDPKFIEAFRKVIKESQFASLTYENDDEWLISDNEDLMKKLLVCIKDEYIKHE